MPKAKPNRKSSMPQNQPQQPTTDMCQSLSDSGYHRARVLSLSEYDKIVGGITWAISVLGQKPEGEWKFREDEPQTPKKSMTVKKGEVNEILAALYKMNCPHKLSSKDLLEVNKTKLEPVVKWLLVKTLDWEFNKDKIMEAFQFLKEDHESVEIGVAQFHCYLNESSRLFTAGPKMDKFDPSESSEMSVFFEALCSQINKLELPRSLLEAENLFLKKVKKFFQKKEEMFFHLEVKKYCAAKEGELLQIDCDRLAKKVSQIEKRIALLMKDFDEKMKIEVEKLENGEEKDVGFFDEDVDRVDMDQGFCKALGLRLQDAHADFLQCNEKLSKLEKDKQLHEPSSSPPSICDPMETLTAKLKEIEEFDPTMGTKGLVKGSAGWEYCVAALAYITDACHFFTDWVMKAGKLDAADCVHLDHRLEQLRNEAKNAQKMLDFAEEKVEKFKHVYSTIKILQYQLPVWENVYKLKNRSSVSNAGTLSSVGPDNS